MKTYLAIFIAVLVLGAPVAKAGAADDGFGPTYFTAQGPSAFGDSTANVAVAADDTEISADEISKIEPAAGGDSVFTLPDDPSAVSGTTPGASIDGEHLVAPTEPVVPGMTAPQTK